LLSNIVVGSLTNLSRISFTVLSMFVNLIAAVSYFGRMVANGACQVLTPGPAARRPAVSQLC
jgi:hypothetical protein